MPFSGTGTGIQNANDVFFSGLSSDQVIRYNNATSKWNNTSLSVAASDLVDGAVTEPKLNVSNSPSTNHVLSWNGSAMTWVAPGSATIDVKEDGSTVTTAVSSINFTGSNVTASAVGNDVTVSVTSGSGRLGEVEVASFSGATYSDKFRNALAWAAGQSPKPALILTPGSTIDAGTTPFTIPPGVSLVGGAAVQTEFGHNCPIYARHTGGSAVFTFDPPGSNNNGCKGWSMSHIAFEGTGSQVLFQDQPFDLSDSLWAYSTLDNVCVDQFNHVYHGPMLGVTIKGTTYYNNMTNTAWYITGSDNCLWTDGAFFEMNAWSSTTYAAKAAVYSMVRMGSLAKTLLGPMYITGSPTTPLSLSGGSGGICIENMTIEGRPSPGSGPNYMWCAGELVRLTGGSAILRNKWYGYAMKDPSATGRVSEGYIHITGGNHLIDGGCVQVYPEQAASPPPFIRITGGSVVVRNITRGSNTTQKPVVLTTNATFVDADSTVTVTVG